MVYLNIDSSVREQIKVKKDTLRLLGVKQYPHFYDAMLPYPLPCFRNTAGGNLKFLTIP